MEVFSSLPNFRLPGSGSRIWVLLTGSAQSRIRGETKASLLKGSFDKACVSTCRFLCRSPPHPPALPTPSRGRPLPHRKISGLNSLGLDAFAVSDLNRNFHINRPKSPGCPWASRMCPWDASGAADHQIPLCDFSLSVFLRRTNV